MCVLSIRPDPHLGGVYLDRSSVDFGFSSAGVEETITLINNSNTEVRWQHATQYYGILGYNVARGACVWVCDGQQKRGRVTFVQFRGLVSAVLSGMPISITRDRKCVFQLGMATRCVPPTLKYGNV